MNPLITLIIGMLALASFVLVWAIGGLWAEVSDPARQRLSRLMSAQQTVMRATRGKTLERLASAGRFMLAGSGTELQQVSQRLTMAGLHQNQAALIFFGVKLLLALLATLLGWLFFWPLDLGFAGLLTAMIFTRSCLPHGKAIDQRLDRNCNQRGRNTNESGRPESEAVQRGGRGDGGGGEAALQPRSR